MLKPTFILIFLLTTFCSYKVSPRSAEKVNWIEFKDLAQKLKVERKPVIIDLYTDWCHWCKVMEKETYQNPKVATYLNEKFITVNYNAESKEPITWRNKLYTYNPQYKINTLSVDLTKGQLSFPTTIIIPSENSDPIPIAGFLKPKELELILKYFGSGADKTETFPEFQKKFHASW